MRAQAALLTATNATVRGLGFVMRVLLSRVLGAEALGVMELAGSAHMLFIAPVTAGLPLAVSRLTAQSKPDARRNPLRAGLWIVRRAALALMPLLLLLSPLIARLFQDERTLPALVVSVPCVLVLGYSAVYNGFFYGAQNAWPPALSELLEQCVRFALTMGILVGLPNLTTPWRAAVPAFATTVAEIAGLVLVVGVMRAGKDAGRWADVRRCPPDRKLVRTIVRLSLPATATRLLNTGLRSVNAVFIPLRLRASGLVQAEATARFGMLSGMAMPLLMLPGVFTSALAMLATPAMASREGAPRALRALAARLIGAALAFGVVCAVALYAFAPTLSTRLYRAAELTPLLRLLCPMVVVQGAQQVMMGMIAGLGRQKQALYGSVAGAAVTLALSWALTVKPEFRLMGAGLATLLGTLTSGVCQAVVLASALRRAGRRDAGRVRAGGGQEEAANARG